MGIAPDVPLPGYVTAIRGLCPRVGAIPSPEDFVWDVPDSDQDWGMDQHSASEVYDFLCFPVVVSGLSVCLPGKTRPRSDHK